TRGWATATLLTAPYDDPGGTELPSFEGNGDASVSVDISAGTVMSSGDDRPTGEITDEEGRDADAPETVAAPRSVVETDLGGLVPAGLELQRGVLDVEVALEAVLKGVEHHAEPVGVEHLVLDDHVRGDHRDARGDGPGVQVVHGDHALDPAHVL